MTFYYLYQTKQSCHLLVKLWDDEVWRRSRFSKSGQHREKMLDGLAERMISAFFFSTSFFMVQVLKEIHISVLVFQTVSVFVIECWCRTLWCYPSISFSGSVSGIVIECWSRTFCNVIPPFRALGLSQLLNVGVGLSVMLFLHFALWVFLRLYPLRLLVYALYSTELQGILSRIANHFTCCLCM